MKLKDYGRTHKKRRAFINQEDLLLVGIDVSKAKHDAIFDQTNQTITFKNDREGFATFEHALRKNIMSTQSRNCLIAMEPSGLYWQGLFTRLKQCGYYVCLANCLAVKNNRRTMQDGLSKTDKKDARSILDLLQQGKFFLPVVRDKELSAAFTMMKRHMSYKKRISQLRNQLRGVLHLSFPEFNTLVPDITQPTSLRFLISNPTPEIILRNGQKRFIEKWRPRRKSGQWSQAKLTSLYEAARHSIGIKDAYRVDAMEIRALAEELQHALTRSEQWVTRATDLVEHRHDLQLLLTLPRIGKATATALLSAIGNIEAYSNGKQLVKLAGLDIRFHESGSSINRRPRISHVGSNLLRHWVYYYSLRLVGHCPEFQAIHARYKENSPGRAAGMRGMMTVCDKVLRIIYAMLSKNQVYQPEIDNKTKMLYSN